MTGPASPSGAATVLLAGSTEWLAELAGRIESDTDATVRTAETAEEAIGETDTGHIDCVLTAYALDDATGVDLVDRIRTDESTVPVLLATANGDEAIASEAIGAGVTDYLVVDDPVDQAIETILDRVETALRSTRQAATQRDRARQFDAVFHDSQTATWVLDPDGTLTRANERAFEMVDVDDDAVLGESFWSLPWWSHTEATQNDIRQLVAAARDGTSGNAIIAAPSTSNFERVIDLSVRPVANAQGDLVSIVVRGVDITERVSLERDLRQSEELHRVTLNNMTDTVLITDEDGEYTYVCPNVHFIFGYTADEIREKETIGDLLGEDLFDREELAETGSLKNIECTATDKAGREHTLLVNVREVDIQGGKLLYSCRDITKRKQREEALATLQELARGFLYAGTHDEIAQHIVDDAPSVLDLDATAVYLFDAHANELRPVTRSPAMRNLHGPLPRLHVDGDTLPGYGFIEGTTLFFDDVHEADRLDNRATDLRSAGYVPLGDHGVFVAGSADVGAFDDVTRELADLLAATAEAALDRVSRESQLREQDQIDHAVSDLLASDERFSFVWVGGVDSTTETLEPRAWAGDEQGYLESQAFDVDADGTEPAGRTAATGEVTMVSNVATDLRDDAWRADALTRDFMSVLSIPLEYNDLTHGVLTVYADVRDAFDETARAVLAELGETIASALSAIERKNALLTTSATRIAFDVDDETFVLSRLAQATDTTLSYQGGVQQTTDGSYVFVTVEEGDIDTVVAAATELAGVDDVRRISDGGNGGVLRLGLARPFLALELADHGAVVREATADMTSTTLTVDVPDSIDVRTVTRLLDEAFTEVALKSKQTLDRAAEHDVYERFLSALTDRQLEVVQTAYYSGFFESPRESTGEDVAAILDISSPAFYQHVRTVQRKLFTTLFEERNVSVPTSHGVQ